MDVWVDLEDGYIVVREVDPDRWIVSWYPFDSGHPDDPGFTLGPEDPEIPQREGLEAVIQWAHRRFRPAQAQHRAA